MKVLLVHKFWKKIGGAEMYYQDTIRILKKYGHDVHAFSTMYDSGGGKDVFNVDDSVTMGHAPEYLKGDVVQKIRNIPETIYSKKNKKIFRDLLIRLQPDIVHVFAIYVTITPSILEVCSELGIPVVMSCNDYKHICPNYRLFHHGKICEDCKGGKFYKAITNNCCKHSIGVSMVSALESYVHEKRDIYRKNTSAFLFESDFMLQKTKEFWSDHDVNLKFLGKPFDATAYTRATGFGDYLLFIGRLSDEKGVDILLKAMQKVPQAKLKIAGSGSWEAHLKKISSELMLNNVEFLGAVHGEELQNLIAHSRFIVVPSLWYENFPYVMTETFALGKAIIGSDKGGIPEYIEHGKTGYTYPSNDHKQLAHHIEQLWDNERLAKEMGASAKISADLNFNDEVFYTRLNTIYQEVLAKEK